MKEDKHDIGETIMYFVFCLCFPVIMWIFLAYGFGQAEERGEKVWWLDWVAFLVPVALWVYWVTGWLR